jgi:hypothetical protein
MRTCFHERRVVLPKNDFWPGWKLISAEERSQLPEFRARLFADCRPLKLQKSVCWERDVVWLRCNKFRQLFWNVIADCKADMLLGLTPKEFRKVYRTFVAERLESCRTLALCLLRIERRELADESLRTGALGERGRGRPRLWRSDEL